MNQLREEQKEREEVTGRLIRSILAKQRELNALRDLKHRFLTGNAQQSEVVALLDSDSQTAGDAERLAFAIESAAVKAGIIEARQHALTGPQLLMLCDDLANAASNPATAMRDKCVEKVKELIEQWAAPESDLGDEVSRIQDRRRQRHH